MKKRLICAVLTLTMAIALLSGCSLFATGDGGEKDSGVEPVKLTDSYAFADPEDLDFDSRYVVVCDENSVVVSSDTMVTYGVQKSYYVVYGKEDQTVALYDFYVCDTAENAQGLLEFYVNDGNNIIQIAEEDATVLRDVTDPDKLAATITMLADAGLMSGTDAKAYAEFCVASYGGMLAE